MLFFYFVSFLGKILFCSECRLLNDGINLVNNFRYISDNVSHNKNLIRCIKYEDRLFKFRINAFCEKKRVSYRSFINNRKVKSLEHFKLSFDNFFEAFKKILIKETLKPSYIEDIRKEYKLETHFSEFNCEEFSFIYKMINELENEK
jgi:hypothetical protein